jgi:hypothetical protein
MSDGSEFLVRLRPVRDPIRTFPARSVSIRLRLFLKLALRAFGLKAVSIEELAPEKPNAGAAAARPPPCSGEVMTHGEAKLLGCGTGRSRDGGRG